MEGNQMKMRDALLKLRAEIGLFYNNEWIPYDAWQGCDDLISHALSEPPRNCDVGTSDEQAERFENFCLKHIGCAEETGGRHCVGCPLEKASRNITQKCELYWAQTPYAEQEGGEK